MRRGVSKPYIVESVVLKGLLYIISRELRKAYAVHPQTHTTHLWTSYEIDMKVIWHTYIHYMTWADSHLFRRLFICLLYVCHLLGPRVQRTPGSEAAWARAGPGSRGFSLRGPFGPWAQNKTRIWNQHAHTINYLWIGPWHIISVSIVYFQSHKQVDSQYHIVSTTLAWVHHICYRHFFRAPILLCLLGPVTVLERL